MLANFSNEAKTFGGRAQTSSEKRSLRRDGAKTLGYRKLDTALDARLLAVNPDLASVWAPTSIGAVLFQQVRERKAEPVTAHLKPTRAMWT